MKTVLLLLAIFLACDHAGTVCINAQQAAEPWDARADEQNAEQEMKSDEVSASEEMQGSMEGQVVSVDNLQKTLTIREDAYGDEMNTFFVNRDTTFTAVDSLSDISAGDKVSIDYFAADDRNIADSILVEERGHSEESEVTISKVLVD